MKHVAFYRNLNLGRPHCPTRAQFEAAFLDAGADAAQSFLTNGTLVFTTGTGPRARQVLARANRNLQTVCGLTEPVFLRRVDALTEMVARDPFAAIVRDDVHECCVTLLHADAVIPASAARRSTRGDVELIRVDDDAVFSLSRRVGRSPGSPNAFIEKLLGLPATTRAWNTVARLVARHG